MAGEQPKSNRPPLTVLNEFFFCCAGQQRGELRAHRALLPQPARPEAAAVRVTSRSISPPWGFNPIPSGSPHVRPAPCGPWVRVVSQTKPRKIPTGNVYITGLVRGQVPDVDQDVQHQHGYAPRAGQLNPDGGQFDISSGSPHVRPTRALSTCGEPDEMKKNTHPENITAPIL